MIPGTVVEVISGHYCGRIGEVEGIDPEWAGVAPDAIVVRLVTIGRRPVERVVVRRNEVVVLDLRGTRH